MKLSDINISTLGQQDELIALYDNLNDTFSEYPRDRSIVDIFDVVAKQSPNKKALVMGEQSLTYRELDEQSNQMANWLVSLGVQEESIVGIYLSRSIELIVSILGVLKAGGAYLPINTDYPFDRIKYILTESKAGFLISEKKYIRQANRLQWYCADLRAIMCIDSSNFYSVIEKRNELMRKELWEYVGDKATDDITGGGWLNSYTAESFTRAEMDEYANNALEKLKPYLGKDKKVLEIGCASGITMYPIAPFVKMYYGTDISQTIINYNRRLCKEKGIDNIRLRCIEAEDISLLEESDFDIIIINSVIQAFSGFNYLRRIIDHCLNLLGPKGIVFLGDIMDMEKKDQLLTDVHRYKKQNPHAKTKLDFSDEMFVPRSFFDDLRIEFPSIQNVHHTYKIHTIENELTRYRFDTILKVDKQTKSAKEGIERNKFQFDEASLSKFETTPCGVEVVSNQLSNIIFTSGSTGKPKGVMVEHKSIIRTVKNTNYINITPDDVILQGCEISFDPSCIEVFGSLLNGATLCLISKKKLFNTIALGNYLVKHDVSIVQLVASLFQMHIDSNPALFANVRLIMLGGEVLSYSHVKRAKDACPNLRVLNCYGPTENTINTTTFEINSDCSNVPIGKPVSNTGIYIINKNGRLQPPGVSGELVVFGDGLARGYLNNKKLTNEKFVDNPFRPGEKIYKTGDLVRLRKDQNIEFLGRIDDQIKVKGHRVELIEIENALLAIPQIKEVKLLLTNEHALCAYITLFEDIELEVLKQLLSIDLPFYMIPQYIVKLEQFPRNLHGKIDSNALPDPTTISESIKDTYVAPRNKLESRLVEIYQNVLEKEKIGIKDDFFEQGGHSLLATKVLSVLHKELDSKIRLEDIFENTTVEKLALIVQNVSQQEFVEIEALPKQDYYDLSYAQRRLWVVNYMDEYKLAYNMADAYLLEGNVNKGYLEASFQELVKRHEILRTTFVEVEGQPKQCVKDDVNVQLAYFDLKDCSEPDPEARDILNEAAKLTFDLLKGPLLKIMLLQLADKRFVFFMKLHHIISDGWSMELMIREIASNYNAKIAGTNVAFKPLTIQYKDFAAWQNKLLLKDNFNQYKRFWNDQFSKQVKPLNLPLDFERPPVKLTDGGKIFFKIDKKQSNQIIDIGNQHGTTVYMTVLALLNLFIYKLTGARDIVIGTPVAGREHVSLHNQIGLYLNTLAIRNQIGKNDSFSDFLISVKKVALAAFENQIYPLDFLIEDLKLDRDVSRSPLFDVGFTWQNIEDKHSQNRSGDFNGFKILPFKYDQQKVKADLWFHGWEENNIIYLSMTYAKSLFKKETALSFIEDFKAVCAKLLNAPDDHVIQSVESVKEQQLESKRLEKKKKSLKNFLNTKKKFISIDGNSLVKTSILNQDKGYPIVIQPNIDGIILTEWLKDNQKVVDFHLRQIGAILFRGFKTYSISDFENVSEVIGKDQMKYVDQSSPRSLVADKIYTSTDYPADQKINMHNELSYSQDWPMQIIFFAMQPPITGGETPISDSRKVLQYISEETKSKFIERGIKYVRNLVDGLGLSWKEVYQTNNKEEVEVYCRKHDINFEWIADYHLKILWNKPAIYNHPYTGETVWFNHGFFFNSFNLDPNVRSSIGDSDQYPSNTFYGDGSRIEDHVMEELKNAFEKAKVTFTWKKGDILVMDNMLMAHGRNSFTGERKILVSMNTSYNTLAEVQEK